MTKISIIIPVYNTSCYVSQCIESVTNQKFNHFEIIIIDDNSTDNSVELINSFYKNDKRIKLLRNDTNLGAGAARNRGIETAQGDYILFIDSDDFLSEISALDMLYKKAVETNADLVLFKHHILNSDTNKINHMLSQYDRNTWQYIETKIDINKTHTLDDFLAFLIAPAYPWNKFIKRKLLIKNKIRCTETFCHNDLALSWKSMVMAQRIAFVPESFITHRHAPTRTQITNDSSKRRLDIFRALDEVNNFLLQKKIPDHIYLYYLKFKWDCFFWGIIKISPKYRLMFTHLIKKDIKATPKKYWKEYVNKFVKDPREKFKIFILRFMPSFYPFLFHIFRKRETFI